MEVLEEQDLQDQMQTVLGMDQVAVMEMEVAEEEVGEVVEEVAEVEEMVVEDEWVGLVVLVELAVWDQMALTVTHSGTALAVVEEVEEVEEAQVEEEGEALEATEGAAVTAGEEGRDQ